MSRRTRIRGCVLAWTVALGLAAGALSAQDWAAGASWGVFNDVSDHFKLDRFHSRDVSAWLDFAVERDLIVRGSYVNIRDDHTKLDAFTAGVDYLVYEGFATSGIFGGIGGYGVKPGPLSTAPKETVFGFHVGVDADFRLHKRVSFVSRLTFHHIFTETPRSLLVASVGFAVRF